MQEETELGQLLVRPLHEAHSYETALILTEAFLVDKRPPEFSWMLCARLASALTALQHAMRRAMRSYTRAQEHSVAAHTCLFLSGMRW